MDLPGVVNLAIGRSESFLGASHAAVQEITRLVNCAYLSCLGIGITDEDMKALRCHLAARRTNQERRRMRMSPMHAGSATQGDDLVPVLRTADGRGNICSSGSPKTHCPRKMTPKEQTKRKLRGSHVSQPLIPEDHVLRLVVTDLPNDRIFEISSQP